MPAQDAVIDQMRQMCEVLDNHMWAQQKFLKVPLYGDHLGDHLQYGQWEVELEDNMEYR